MICDVNAAGEVRFGLAQFRRSGSDNDPNGAYVAVPVNDYKWDHDGNPATAKVAYSYSLNGVTRTHEEHLKTAITGLDGESWTPLGEGLFQIYTYFMSRTDANRPFGKDGVTRFPKYVYKTDDTTSSNNGGSYNTSGAPTVPDSPVQYSCQKNFVVVLTDGEPTKDDFDKSNSSQNTWQGFPDFKAKLIGDYNPDNTVPEAGNEEKGDSSETAYYLDDVAKFMHEIDFRLDLSGDQTFDVYTVGFTTGTGTPAEQVLTQDRQRRRRHCLQQQRPGCAGGIDRGLDRRHHPEVAGLHGRDGARDADIVRRKLLHEPLRSLRERPVLGGAPQVVRAHGGRRHPRQERHLRARRSDGGRVQERAVQEHGRAVLGCGRGGAGSECTVAPDVDRGGEGVVRHGVDLGR